MEDEEEFEIMGSPETNHIIFDIESDSSSIPLVTITTLNLRSGPGITYSIIKTVPPNTLCEYYGENYNGFYKIICENVNGAVWASSQYLKSHTSASNNTPISDKVLGNILNVNEVKWLKYIGQKVVPQLTSYYNGNREIALQNAAIVAWWSLKEGILQIENAIRFNLCDPNHVVKSNQWDGICAKENGFGTWQVGLAAIQSPITEERAKTMIVNLENNICKKLGLNPNQALLNIVNEAGFGNDIAKNIMSSQGRLRASWLLRIPSVSFVVQLPIINNECFSGNVRNWCYSSKWSPSNKYSPTIESMSIAVNDVKNILSKY
ncbi:hypothetical protein ABK040_003962 [Willaertia magna]